MPLITLFCFLPIDITLSLLALQDLYDEQGNMKSAQATAGRAHQIGSDQGSDEALLGGDDIALSRIPRTITPRTISAASATTAPVPSKWSVAAELKTGGVAAIFASLTGGLGVIYFALSPTRIANDCGGSSNVASLSALVVTAVTMLAGSQFVSFMPPFYVGGLLFYAGIGYILDGVADGLSYYSKAEYAVIWVIVIASVALGSFAAIGIGIALAILIFVVRYSSSPFVRLVRHAEPAQRGGSSGGGGLGSASPSAAWTRSVSEYVHQSSAEIAV
jgi:MFS superfamily sulfate permease-like transporter